MALIHFYKIVTVGIDRSGAEIILFKVCRRLNGDQDILFFRIVGISDKFVVTYVDIVCRIELFKGFSQL